MEKKKQGNMRLIPTTTTIYLSLVLFVANLSNIQSSRNVNITSARNARQHIIRKVRDVLYVMSKRTVFSTLPKILLKNKKNKRRRTKKRIELTTRLGEEEGVTMIDFGQGNFPCNSNLINYESCTILVHQRKPTKLDIRGQTH